MSGKYDSSDRIKVMSFFSNREITIERAEALVL